MKVMEIATCMIAFSTFIAVFIAFISYLNQIIKLSFIEIFLYSVIYININLLFLLYLKKRFENE